MVYQSWSPVLVIFWLLKIRVSAVVDETPINFGGNLGVKRVWSCLMFFFTAWSIHGLDSCWFSNPILEEMFFFNYFEETLESWCFFINVNVMKVRCFLLVPFFQLQKSHILVGCFGTFFIFPYIGNNHPNWLSYVSEG
jgi:hypothetical protein